MSNASMNKIKDKILYMISLLDNCFTCFPPENSQLLDSK